MVRIAVCDDDPYFLVESAQKIKAAFKGRTEKFTIEVRMYPTADALLRDHQTEPFDIAFLDIDLPGMDGFQASAEFRKYSPNGLVVFVTNYYKKVFEAQRYGYLYFICKGSFDEDLVYVTQMCLKNIAAYRKPYIFEYRKKTYSISKLSIMIVKASRNNIIIITRDGSEYKQHIPITAVASTVFWKKPFIQVNRGVIINMHHILKIEDDLITMMNLDEIHISESRKEEVWKQWKRFCKHIKSA